MNRKTWWLAAGLLAMLGCTEAANVPSTDTTKPLNPTPAPAAPQARREGRRRR